MEEALENLKNKAGKDGMSFWFARPGVVAQGIFTTQYYKIGPEFPKDLSVKIIKEGRGEEQAPKSMCSAATRNGI